MITKPSAVEPETQDEDQISNSNRELEQEAEIWGLCRTLHSLKTAKCHLIPVSERIHSDTDHDQGLKRNIQDLQHESYLRKMETKSNSHQNQTPDSSNTTDSIQSATPDEPETPSLHQPCLTAHYGMNGGEEHQTPETITAPSKPVTAPLGATHQTSAVTKSDTTPATSMLGTVSSVLTAPVPFEVASSPTTVASAAPTFTVSSAFAPSSIVTADFKLPLISLTPAAPSVQEGPTVHVVVDEDQATVQTPDTEALQTPTPVSALPPTVPNSALVEPSQEAPAPSSCPSGQEAVLPFTVVETPYFGTASSDLSTTVPGGFATPVFGQAPRILKRQSSIKASDFSFKPSSSGKQRGFGHFHFSTTSSSFNLTLISDTQAFQSPTPVLALTPTVPKSALVEPTKKVPAASSCPSDQEAVLPSTAVETPYFGTSALVLSTTVPGGFAKPVFGQAPRILKPQSSIKAANFSFNPSTCDKQRGFGKFNISATSSSFGLQSNNSSFNFAITERQSGINTTPSSEQEGPTVHVNVDENQAPDQTPNTQTFQTQLPVLALPSTVPSSALVEPTQGEPAASICPSSQELILPSTAVETPYLGTAASGLLSSVRGGFATPVFSQAPTNLGPESSMTAANLSFRPSTCGTQRGFGQFSINETSSSFGLQSNNSRFNFANTDRRLGINTTSSFGQSPGSVQVNPSSFNMSPGNFSFHPTFPSCGHQLVRSQPVVSDVDFSLAPLGFSTQSALDETPAASTFRRRRWRNHSTPVRSSSDIIPHACREEVWSSSRTTSYIQSGRGRRNCKISVTVQSSSRPPIDRSRNHYRGFGEQPRVGRLQEYCRVYFH